MKPITFGIAGNGWRADFYLRIAQHCPKRFKVAALTSRSAETRTRLEQTWGVKTFESVQQMVKHTELDFVVTSVPWETNPGIVTYLAENQIPCLSETPPAPDIEGLIKLNQIARQHHAKIQIAEQFHLQPAHAARIAAVESGVLGNISQIQLSVAHGYHAISLIRKILGVGYETADISGVTFESELINGPGRYGPPAKEEIITSEQHIFRIQFGGKLAIVDFSTDQYFSPIRNARVLIRGHRGEIMNNEVVYLKDYLTPVRLEFIRHSAGGDGDLRGLYLEGIQLGDEWLYTNPFIPARLTDEELAIASCLEKMADYVETGRDFYSLAQGSQDQYLSLMMDQALHEQKTLRTELMEWSA